MFTAQEPIDRLLSRLAQTGAVLVVVGRTKGSVPREAGTWMAVLTDEVLGTIGGGHLELQAIAHARQLLRDPLLPAKAQRHALGPSLGQCCGGVVELRFERIAAADALTLAQRLRAPMRSVALFGGGHVGQAIVRLLLTLPCDITWVDSRDSVFPTGLPAQVRCEHSQPVQRAVDDLRAGSEVLIMSFSHAEDLDILAQCLQRQRARGDLPYIGLIGSQTKWAVFRKRLKLRGFTEDELDHVTCPIGVPGIKGKEPAVIAVAVAAQLLMR
ncbi:MAG: xanthine dehydrogenase accessory protein XdhC [Comamonadaceae bacterium]|jgi:xanthine dehydrogenase accessory factor|nr:xanthine dehydrogenase accessory protein XdhC [Comamonadaceae bacterium]